MDARIDPLFQIIITLANATQRLLGYVEQLQEENQRLKEKVTLLTDHRFGKKRESAADTDNTADKGKETVSHDRYRKKQTGQKQDLFEGLPKEVRIHDIDETAKTCGCCDQPLTLMGESRSQELDYIPAQLKVIEHVTLKYSCRRCNAMCCGKKPESLFPKCLGQ